MNRYREAMEQCAPPEGLQARLREKVCAQKPKRRKRILLAVLAAALVLCMGANAIWDPLFIRRFGPKAAFSKLAGAVFQEVNVTAVCDDVELTVTQALCSDSDFHLIFYYKLPDDIEVGDSPPRVHDTQYYITGDYSWEEYRDLEREKWAEVDWTDLNSQFEYKKSSILHPVETWAGGGGSGQPSYDPETRTIRYYAYRSSLHYYDGQETTLVDLTAQPLTIYVAPPLVEQDGEWVPVTDHPAIVTFQPVYDGPQRRSGEWSNGEIAAKVQMSPFSLYLEAQNMGYEYYEDLLKDVYLVKENGAVSPIGLHGLAGGGTWSELAEGCSTVTTTVHFFGITDIMEYSAVRIGEYEIALE